VTTTSSRLVIALAITTAVLMLIGFLFVLERLTGEYWCSDRVPWWGPPTDPDSSCSGFAWVEKHPGEYPVDSAEIARQEGEPGMGGLLLYICGLSALVCRQV
jgi:hypothetical protein